MKELKVTNYLQEWCGLYRTYRCWFLYYRVWNSREIASIMLEFPVLHSFKENWLTPVSPLFCSLFLHPAEPPPCLYFSLVLAIPLPIPEKTPGSCIPASDEPGHQRSLWCLCHLLPSTALALWQSCKLLASLLCTPFAFGPNSQVSVPICLNNSIHHWHGMHKVIPLTASEVMGK